MLVEDDPDHRTIYRTMLQASGYEVVEALEGGEAVRMATDHPPDLILMDLGVPGIDGLEATRRLKREPRTSKVPVVALTALVLPQTRDEARAAGCAAYLAKPVEPRVVVEVVRRLAGPADAA
ncbi:MAG TPA: response regulator [Longimicrobium sp.]|jgi:two-component system cell cycle response regulator DivK